MIGSNWIRAEGAIWVRDVFRAIDDVLVAGHTLHHALKRGHVPFGRFEDDRWIATPLAEGVARYGNSLPFAIWQMLRAVETLRIAFTGKASQQIDLGQDEPDEAPGLTAERPPSKDEGADQQPKLALATGDT